LKIFGTGTGRRGLVKAGTNPAGTVELSDANSVVNFEVGMYLEASAANGGGALRADKPYITAIDRTTGILTVSASVVGSWVAGDSIFAMGDYDTAIAGTHAWIPYDDRAALIAAPFYGVTRNVDSFRLGGLVLDTSGSNYEEGLIDALGLIDREGVDPDLCVMHPSDYSVLVKILGSKVQHIQISKEIKEGDQVMASVGFNGIMLNAPTGNIRVISDRSQQRYRAQILTLDTWKMCSIGSAVRLFEGDGLKMLRSSSSDALDIRTFSYANLGCTAPGLNAIVTL
jgi:hypothetical protein